MEDVNYFILNPMFLKYEKILENMKQNIEINFKVEENIDKIRRYIKILKSQPKKLK